MGKDCEEVFDAIGLGKIFEFLTFTFCDLLKLIGLPFAINLSNATLPKPVHPEVIKDPALLTFSEGTATFDGDGETQSFAIPSGKGSIHVFVNGEAQAAGILGTYSISGGNITFRNNSVPNVDDMVSILKI